MQRQAQKLKAGKHKGSVSDSEEESENDFFDDESPEERRLRRLAKSRPKRKASYNLPDLHRSDLGLRGHAVRKVPIRPLCPRRQGGMDQVPPFWLRTQTIGTGPRVLSNLEIRQEGRISARQTSGIQSFLG